MDIWLIIGVLILVIAFIASLQLDLATLTLMSGHSLGRQTSRKRLVELIDNFVLGVGFITWLLISTTSLVLYFSFADQLFTARFWSLMIIFLGVQIALSLIAILLKPNNPNPWIWQEFRHFLTNRAEKTHSPAEAFSLGVTSQLAQLPVLILPLALASISLLALPGKYLVWGTVGFSLVVSLPLFIIGLLIKTGTNIASIQSFIISNRRFFKIMLILCLVTLSIFIISYLNSLAN